MAQLVWIPIITRGTNKVQFLEVFSRTATTEERKNKADMLEPIELFSTICLDSACLALEANRRWLFDMGMMHSYAEQDNQRLDFHNLTTSLNGIEDNSAELGLALSLLLGLTDTPRPLGLLAATGQFLERLPENIKIGQSDLSLEPVGSITEKLEAFLTLVKEQQHGNTAFQKTAWNLLFIPTATQSGVNLESLLRQAKGVSWQAVEYSPQVTVEKEKILKCFRELIQAGVDIHPVASFGAAAEILGVKPKRPRWPVYAALGLALLAGLSSSLYQSAHQPLSLRNANHQAVFKPFIVCRDAQTQRIRPQPKPIHFAMTNGETLPIVPPGALLAWEIVADTVKESESWQHHLWQRLGQEGYPVALVMVGENSEISADSVKIPKPGWLNPGSVFRHAYEVGRATETNLFMLLVNRSKSFDREALLDQLREPSLRAGGLSAIRAYLQNQADATLDFRFRSEGEDYACR